MRVRPFVYSIPFLAGVSLAGPTFSDTTHSVKNALIVERSAEPDLVLVPAVHWSVSTRDTRHVQATPNQHALYYAEDGVADPNAEHHFGATIMNFTVPAVNLDNTEHVSIDSADGKGTVTFANQASFDVAYRSWLGHEELLLLTYSPKCTAYDSGDFCYIIATNLSLDNATRTATANVHSVKIADYLVSTDFEWGVYVPESKPAVPVATSKKRATKSTSTTHDRACAALDSNGLPIVTLGPDFDQRLDDCRGYAKASSFPWYHYAGSVGANQETVNENVGDSKNMSGTIDLIHFAKADAEANAEASKIAATHPQETGTTSKRDLVAFEKRKWLSWLPIKIPGVNTPISKDFSKDLSWSLPNDRGQDDSPWGKAKLLKKFTGEKSTKTGSASASGEISVYCVNCGTDGSVTIYGKGSFSVDSGLTEGFVTVTTNVNIGFALGLDIQAKFVAKESTQLAVFAVPGLNFGIIAVGPLITLGADFIFTAEAEGKILAGAKFVIQNAQSRLDFVNPGSSGSSGWTPQMVPIFEASGEIKIGAELGLPVGFSVGINILNGKFVKSVGLVDRPALEAKAEFKATADTSGAKVVVTDGCAGVSTEISFKNELYADILGTKKSLMDPYVKSLAKGCIKVGSQSSSSVASSTQSTSTNTAINTPSNVATGTVNPTDPAATTGTVNPTDPAATTDTPANTGTNTETTSPTNTPESGFQVKHVESEKSVVVKNPTIAADVSITHNNFHGYNTTRGQLSLEYTELVDATAAYFLTSCPDSNLYMQPRSQQGLVANDSCARVFESHKSSVVGDSYSRLFHYYNDSMEALGVSRLRLHSDRLMPKGAIFVNFYAFSNNTGELEMDADVNNDNSGADAYYIARDSNGGQFFPALCAYKDATNNPPKLFLIKDQDAGLSTLATLQVQQSVTGAEVDECYLIPFMQASGERGAAWNDHWNADQGSEGATVGAQLDNTEDF